MKSDKSDDKQSKKEDEVMAVAMRNNEATIIKNDMLLAFMKELNANKPSESYWDECLKSKVFFSSSDIDEMKKMYNSENDE